MKSLNHDTCHLSRHDCDVKKLADDKDTDAFMLLYFLTAKQQKADHVGPPLVTRQVSNLLVVHFIGRLSLETKPRRRSWPTLSIVWRQLKSCTTSAFCVQELLGELESQFVGCWKGALCGLLLHQDDRGHLDRATAKVIAKFDNMTFNEPLLKVSKYGSSDLCSVALWLGGFIHRLQNFQRIFLRSS